MRSIEVSTDVYARIWASRLGGEESEDAILRRLLLIASPHVAEEGEGEMAKVLWRDDVKAVLEQLGASPLTNIYRAVRDRRLRAGRNIPASLEAIVRRELEYNSTDSDSFQGRFDWFTCVHGKGAGVWALR